MICFLCEMKCVSAMKERKLRVGDEPKEPRILPSLPFHPPANSNHPLHTRLSWLVLLLLPQFLPISRGRLELRRKPVSKTD